MKKEGEYMPKKNGFVSLIESNRTVKTTSTLVCVVGLSEMVLNLDQSSEDFNKSFCNYCFSFSYFGLICSTRKFRKNKISLAKYLASIYNSSYHSHLDICS